MPVTLNPKANTSSSSTTGTKPASISPQQALSLARPLKWLFSGDSIIQFGAFFGSAFGTVTPNLSFFVGLGGDLAVPAAGTHTFYWNAKNSSIAWAAPGDQAGSPVVTQGGLVTVKTANGLSMNLALHHSLLPTTDQVLTAPAIAGQWAKRSGGIAYFFEAACRGAVEVLDSVACSGVTAANMLYFIPNIIDSKPDVCVYEVGINSLLLTSSSVDQIVLDITTGWDLLTAQGITVVARLLAPLWGKLADGSTPGVYPYSAATEASRKQVNRQLRIEAKKRPLVIVHDTDKFLTDTASAQGAIKTGYTIDGIHPDGGVAQEDALALMDIAVTMSPNLFTLVNVGASAYFNSVTAPGGNLIPSNQGSFGGVGGTAGAGCIVGTGLAAGVVAQRSAGANITAVANKVVATDGGADYQELLIYGSLATSETFALYLGSPSIPNFIAGEFYSSDIEVEIIGNGCFSIYTQDILTGAPCPIQAFQMRSVYQGIRLRRAQIKSKPIKWPVGVTAVSPQIFIQTLPGKTVIVRFRNKQLNRVMK